MGKSGEDSEKYQALIWVAPYAHVLTKAFGQAYSVDGTHCMTQHGWRAIPLVVLNSLGNPVPIGIAWAPSENTGALTLLCRQVAAQCKNYGINCPFLHERPEELKTPLDVFMSADWEDPLTADVDVICYPPVRAFVASVLAGLPDITLLPEADDSRSTFMSDGGLAFRFMADLYNLNHLLCKKHLAGNNPLGSTNNK